MSSLDLRFLPIDMIIPHEGYDPRRVQRLVRSFQSTGILSEPLIVTEHHESFVLLDGATRTQALKALCITEAVVQVVEYRNPEVRLRTWNHVIFDFPISRLLAELKSIPGFSTGPSIEFPNAGLELDGMVAQIISPSGECFGIINSCLDMGIAWVLNQIVNIYRGNARVDRSTQSNLQFLQNDYPGFCAAIAFPRLRPSDVLQCAASGDHIPMGITRHIIAERAKNLNLPLNILRDRCSIEQSSQASKHKDTERLANHDMEHQDSISIFP